MRMLVLINQIPFQKFISTFLFLLRICMTSNRRLSGDKEYAALARRLNEAKKTVKSHPERVTGIYLEMAEYLRNSLSMPEEAEQTYEKAISLGQNFGSCALDCSLAFRNLAEMAAEKDAFDSAVDKINASLRFADRTENPGLIQQALHQRAHICMSCGMPEKALTYAEECREYLKQNAAQIDALKKDGDVKCRMAHLQNFMAGIYSELHSSDSLQQYGYDRKALEINEKALNYASDRQNWSLLYRCLLTKLELKIGRERVQLAEKMCEISTKIEPINAAERRFKKEGKCHLALEKLRHTEQCNCLESKQLLWKRYEEIKKEPDCVSADIAEAVKNALIFIYKTEKRLNIANTMTVKDNAKRRHAQMCVFERIGDDASALGMHEIALTFYQRMQKCADRADDKRKAWCSMAESAKDCRLWTQSLKFFREVRKLEDQLGHGEDAMLETDIAIAIVGAEVEDIPVEQRLKQFREVYARCQPEEKKLDILPDYVKFLKRHPNLGKTGELEAKLADKTRLEQRERPNLGNENDQQEDDQAQPDEFDQLDEHQVMHELKKEMKAVERQEKILKERTNENKHGESNLHELARAGEYQQLKELLDKGYDVNHMDNGGWTPLSEAVSAHNFPNVRLLLTRKANPNTRSREPLLDEQENKITATGLTPLMEACSVGHIEIAKILVHFKARTSAKDDDEWTALEYLREYMLNAKGLDEGRKQRLQKLAEFLEQRQAEEGFAARSYSDFLELLDQKQFELQRNSQRKSGGSQHSEQNRDQRRRKRRISGGMSPVDRPSSSRSSFGTGVMCIEDEDDDGFLEIDEGSQGRRRSSQNRWDVDDDDDDEGENEETRNLKSYRRYIDGLKDRGRHGRMAQDAEFASAPTLLRRAAKRSGSGKPFAKRMFFK